MSRDDDDILEPDAPANAAERARAESFGRMVDTLLSGEQLPPAMDSSDRALVESATMIVASSRDLELPDERASELVDQALERSVLGNDPSRPQSVSDLPEAQATRDDPIPLAERRESRFSVILPWTVAACAAAAAIALFVTRPAPTGETARRPVPTTTADLPDTHRSRPADALVGQIDRRRAADASGRLDTIYADRMAGYRDLSFQRSLGETK